MVVRKLKFISRSSRKYRPPFYLLLAVYMSISPIVYSENNVQVYNLSLKELMNVEVISASKFSEKVSQAPSIITSVSKQQIRQYDWITINDVLYTQPGFSPAQDYERPTVASRGNFDSWSNNHLLHLIDGVPFNDNLYGSAYTWLIPLLTTKSLEVIRGPGSALYGSNATNGVVQMNTLNASDLEGATTAKLSYASQGTREIEIITGLSSDDYDFIWALYSHKTDGNEYLSFDGSNRLDSTSSAETGRPQLRKFRTRDEKDDAYFWAKLSIGDVWNIQYHHQEWGFETGHGWVFWIPDRDEDMDESRDILSIKYNSEISDSLSQEYVLRYQNHQIKWNQRYYPDNAFDGFYPSGMWEFLDTNAEDIFVRAQFTLEQPDSNIIWLGGLEVDRFLYDGDNEHYSNIDVDVTFAPFPDGSDQALGPWLDFILNEPVINSALFIQYTNNSFVSNDLSLTLGLRWDKLGVDYIDIYDNNVRKNKDFSRGSPRISLVYSTSDTLVYKFLVGKAFRAPTPTEMAGAHTFSLASNIGELKAELLTTYELQTNWTINDNHLFRGNIFLTKFENQIAYSTVNFNLSSNVYSTKNAGIELELMGNYDALTWFANLSYVKRLDETVLSFFIDENNLNAQPVEEFSEHPDDLKWQPEIEVNAGFAYTSGDLNFSFTTHYQGSTSRRDNELGNPNGFLPLSVDVPLDFSLDDHRPAKIDSWKQFNFQANYRINKQFEFGINIQNLFDEQGLLAKTGPFPFDYQINGRRIKFYVQTTL